MLSYNKVQKINTYLYKDPNVKRLVEVKPIYKPVEHKLNEIMEEIEKLSFKPIKNLDDMFAVLTDKEKLDTVLQIGLDKEYLQYKDKLVEFFIALKGNVRREDLAIRTPLNYCIDRNKCSMCDQPANINCINCFGKDIWLCMNHLMKHRDVHSTVKSR